VSLALLVALLGACGYAAFAGGAVGLPEETWLQAGVVVIAVVAAVAWLGPGALRPAASPWALAGLGLLVAFAVWIGASLLWSVAPDRTWQELNRALMYVLVLAVALAAASTAPRAVERVAVGWLVVATAVAVYALAGAVAPGVLDHATQVARLRAPLEYWNALGLVCVLGVPVAIRLATAVELRPRWRIAAVLALLLLVCCLGLTYSRGGIVALVVAVVVAVVSGRTKLPALAAFGLVAVAAAPVLAFAWTEDALTAGAPPLAEQVDAGLKLGGVLACAAILAGVGAWALLGLERRVTWPPGRSRTVWLALGLVLLGLVAGGVAAIASSERGLRGTVEEAADDFTEPRRDPTFQPGRLLTTSSANRWLWWREAGGAFADEPVLGWGGGSFGVSRRLYRVAPDDVRQPHSAPMQFLAELGTVGAVLGLGALLALLWAAVLRVRARTDGDLAGALLAAAAAWFVHALIDWDWDIPGVTVPALVFLGVLGARQAAPRAAAFPGADDRGGAGRALALAAACLLAAAILASSALPALSDARADRAYRTAGDRGAERLEDAAADAELAARLDPYAVRPLFAAAAVAEGRGRLLEARGHLLDAVDRQPWSVEAWIRLARIAIALADREGAVRAAAQALELDPGNVEVAAFARRAQGILAPAQASATATATPLPAAPGTAPAPGATTPPPGTPPPAPAPAPGATPAPGTPSPGTTTLPGAAPPSPSGR
jgi:tetratricopeptide (TPR) repeat protein